VRLLWTLVRAVIVLAAIVVLTITPLWISSPSGTTLDTSGAVIDAIALAALIVSLWSLWRDRARLV
jgi:hypothetical protein